MHLNNKIVGVWIDKTTPKDLYEENDLFYKRCYELGIDMITTYYPLEAMGFL
jgi:hypothetical protein